MNSSLFLIPTIAAALLPARPAAAQISLGPQPETTFAASQSCWDLAWLSVNQRTYFVQWSADNSVWHYFPDIEPGDGQETIWSCVPSTPGGRFYVRLKYNDTLTTDPDIEDFDNDGIPSLVEVAILGTDPLASTTSTDADADGLLDAWELHYWGNLTAQNGAGNTDGDGLTNKEEFQLALDPTVNESASASLRNTYSYDAAGRLTERTLLGSSITWQLDDEGNILSSQ